MEQWLKHMIVVSIIGFLKDFRPSESFLFVYLTGPWKNFTNDDVNQLVYPMGTYSNAVFLIAMFFLTDICRYKPLIILMGISGILTWTLLIWAKSLQLIQVSEIFYGLFMATDVAFRSYIYTQVSTAEYQKVTGVLKAACLTGKLCSGLISQVLISFTIMNYRQLNFLTLISMIILTLVSMKLSNVKKSVYFNRNTSENLRDKRLNSGYEILKLHMKQYFNNKKLQIFSIIWIINLTMHIQVSMYNQSLWKELVTDSKATIYNGLIDSISRLLGIAASLIISFMKINVQHKWTTLTLFCSLIQGVFLVINANVSNIIYCYICSILYAVLTNCFIVTIFTSEIASCILSDSYGLVFSANMFIVLILQAFLINIVVKNAFWSIQFQYFVYALIHFFVAIILICIIFINYCRLSTRNINNYVNEEIISDQGEGSDSVLLRNSA